MGGATGSGMTAGWLLLAAALSGVIALEVTGHVPLHARASTAPKLKSPEQGPVLRQLQPVVLDEIDDMIDRPLFHLSRRPLLPPDVEHTERPEPVSGLPLLTLVGTFHAKNGAVALFSHREHGMLRKRQGQAIEGWQVDRIDQGRVLLIRGLEREWLGLTKPTSEPATAAQILALQETSAAATSVPSSGSIDLTSR
jgi:hypothetical protein